MKFIMNKYKFFIIIEILKFIYMFYYIKEVDYVIKCFSYCYRIIVCLLIFKYYRFRNKIVYVYMQIDQQICIQDEMGMSKRVSIE